MGDTLTKKELIDIGGRPLLWHVMRIFSAYGHNRFILALGHHADQVRRYFLEYDAMSRDTSLHIGGSSSITLLGCGGGGGNCGFSQKCYTIHIGAEVA